jgi:hypothetical protein
MAAKTLAAQEVYKIINFILYGFKTNNIRWEWPLYQSRLDWWGSG